MPSTESASYTKTAIFLHWLIALAIALAFVLGASLEYLPDESTKSAAIGLHKSVGIAILLLSFVRLGWRLIHHAPPLPATMPLWEKNSARIVHVLLYTAMILQPLSGWALISANPNNIPTFLFGLVIWPSLPLSPMLENKEELTQMLVSAHGLGAALFALLIAGHAAAALRHHFILHNDILLRMSPRFCVKCLNRLRGQA